jgi:hypothetical protein
MVVSHHQVKNPADQTVENTGQEHGECLSGPTFTGSASHVLVHSLWPTHDVEYWAASPLCQLAQHIASRGGGEGNSINNSLTIWLFTYSLTHPKSAEAAHSIECHSKQSLHSHEEIKCGATIVTREVKNKQCTEGKRGKHRNENETQHRECVVSG